MSPINFFKLELPIMQRNLGIKVEKKKAIVSDSLLSINKKIKNDEKNYLDSSCFGWRGGLSVNARFDNLNLPFSIPINFTSITSPSFK